jgi:L-threonylcarbamoyladenylate synthase
MSQVIAAAAALKAGNLVAFPTETVYGLGANAEDESAVAKIYSAKGRPADHPLIVHIASDRYLNFWGQSIPNYAIELAKKYWPGPMTLILKRSDAAKDFVTGGQDSVGLRVPAHPVALELLEAFAELGGKGIAAPSANRFGKVSPTKASAVREELGGVLGSNDFILDGGDSMVGIESTIIDCTSAAPRILRPGAITEEMIEKATGLELERSQSNLRVSGSLESHYSPTAVVDLDVEPASGDGFVAMSNVETPVGVIRLAAPTNLEEYAHVLYSALRAADEKSLQRVVVWQPTGDGIAIAIRDRLQRASNKG